MYKKLIVTGCPRTGTTALSFLLSSARNVLLTNEMGFFYPKKEKFYEKIKKIKNQKGEDNFEILKSKGWDSDVLHKFADDESEGIEHIEFFGDKHPDYCLNLGVINYLIKNNSDAYFIFTYRDPFSTVYSFLKRSKIEKDHNAQWYSENHESALNKIISYNLNWSTLLYPMVDNKTIVYYNKFLNNPDFLVSKLESFLGTKLQISQKASEIYFNENLLEWKKELTPKQVSHIENKFEPVKKHIYSLLD